jgi:hypothetical protein
VLETGEEAKGLRDGERVFEGGVEGEGDGLDEREYFDRM